MRPTTILAMATTIVLASTTPALATRYASPGGSEGAPCTLDAPCTLKKALNGATAGDHVIRLFGGSYADPAAYLPTPNSGTDIAPQPGTGRPVIHLGNSSSLDIYNGSSISDVDLIVDTTGTEPLQLSDSGVVAERLRVIGSAAGPLVSVGGIGKPSVLRDSLVVNTGTGPGANAVKMECNGCHSTAQLAHVTLVSQNAPALVAQADGNGDSVVTAYVVNSIIRAMNPEFDDVRPAVTGGGSGNDAAWINLSDSAFRAGVSLGREHIVINGGHVMTAPQFVDAANGDYTEAPGSPTIDAGAASWLDSPTGLDVLGRPRTLGPATDMGAFEAPIAPVAASGDAADSTLHGTVTPNGAPAAWHFELGTTTEYGTVVGGATSGDGFAPEDVAATASSLQPGTTYHYRLVAEHAYGKAVGEDRTFTTAAAPPPPVAAEMFGGVRFATLRVRLRRGAVRPRLTCPATTPCTGTLRLRSGRRTAKARFTIAPGRTATVRVRMGKAMRRARRLGAVVTATAGGQTATTKVTLRVG